MVPDPGVPATASHYSSPLGAAVFLKPGPPIRNSRESVVGVQNQGAAGSAQDFNLRNPDSSWLRDLARASSLLSLTPQW